jgi:hypothetical protein
VSKANDVDGTILSVRDLAFGYAQRADWCASATNAGRRGCWLLAGHESLGAAGEQARVLDLDLPPSSVAQ